MEKRCFSWIKLFFYEKNGRIIWSDELEFVPSRRKRNIRGRVGVTGKLIKSI